MPEVKITIENEQEVIAATLKAPEKINNALQTAIKKSAYLVEGEAKKQTPVDTGRLRASIFTTLVPLIATIQPKTKYAYWIHEGQQTVRGKLVILKGQGRAGTPKGGKPYMTEGLENKKAEIESTFNNELNKAVKQIQSS